MKLHSIPCFFMIFVFLACGCQKGPKVQFVEGTIKHDGAPLAGAMVSFTPKTDGTGAMSASGETDSSGKYHLTVLQGAARIGSGTTEGEYLVSVVKKTSDPIRMDPPPPAYPNSAIWVYTLLHLNFS